MTDPAGPLKPTELHILLALSDGESHGYALRQEVLRQSEGRLELEAGNLYRHIRRMEEQGLLEESGRRPPPGPSSWARCPRSPAAWHAAR